MLAQQGADKLCIANIATHQKVPPISFQLGQVFSIARVRQQIQINDRRSSSSNPAQDEI